MLRNYAINPFQTTEISIPIEYHDAFERYCQRTKSTDKSPFPRMVDFWFLSVCVATRFNLDPIAVATHKTCKIIDGSIFSSDPWRVHILMFIAIIRYDDMQVVANPSKMMKLANGLAVAGIPKVIEMLTEDFDDPIWNLSESLSKLITSD